jgi:hypothetical protein
VGSIQTRLESRNTALWKGREPLQPRPLRVGTRTGGLPSTEVAFVQNRTLSQEHEGVRHSRVLFQKTATKKLTSLLISIGKSCLVPHFTKYSALRLPQKTTM